jgi:hypothetical protein
MKNGAMRPRAGSGQFAGHYFPALPRCGNGRDGEKVVFHSLRVAWVTLALTEGVPLELA